MRKRIVKDADNYDIQTKLIYMAFYYFRMNRVCREMKPGPHRVIRQMRF